MTSRPQDYAALTPLCQKETVCEPCPEAPWTPLGSEASGMDRHRGNLGSEASGMDRHRGNQGSDPWGQTQTKKCRHGNGRCGRGGGERRDGASGTPDADGVAICRRQPREDDVERDRECDGFGTEPAIRTGHQNRHRHSPTPPPLRHASARAPGDRGRGRGRGRDRGPGTCALGPHGDQNPDRPRADPAAGEPHLMFPVPFMGSLSGLAGSRCAEPVASPHRNHDVGR
ncbi:unnamed protein product [Merluccius merluccius]